MRKINSQLPFSLQHVSLYKLSFHHTRTRPPFMLRKCSCLSERGMTMRACAFTIFQKAKMAATSQYRRISQQYDSIINRIGIPYVLRLCYPKTLPPIFDSFGFCSSLFLPWEAKIHYCFSGCKQRTLAKDLPHEREI